MKFDFNLVDNSDKIICFTKNLNGKDIASCMTYDAIYDPIKYKEFINKLLEFNIPFIIDNYTPCDNVTLVKDGMVYDITIDKTNYSQYNTYYDNTMLELLTIDKKIIDLFNLMDVI